jgi:hypothetical protein
MLFQKYQIVVGKNGLGVLLQEGSFALSYPLSPQCVATHSVLGNTAADRMKYGLCPRKEHDTFMTLTELC